MIRRPPRSTQSRSSAASDVYKRQGLFSRFCLRSWRRASGSRNIGHGQRQLEGGPMIGIDQPYRAAMGVEHGANDGEAHSGAAAVAPGGEKAVEDLVAVVGRDAFAVISDGYLQPDVL